MGLLSFLKEFLNIEKVSALISNMANINTYTLHKQKPFGGNLSNF